MRIRMSGGRGYCFTVFQNVAYVPLIDFSTESRWLRKAEHSDYCGNTRAQIPEADRKGRHRYGRHNARLLFTNSAMRRSGAPVSLRTAAAFRGTSFCFSSRAHVPPRTNHLYRNDIQCMHLDALRIVFRIWRQSSVAHCGTPSVCYPVGVNRSRADAHRKRNGRLIPDVL